MELHNHQVLRISDGHVISTHSGYDRGVRLCYFLLDHVSLLSIQKDCSVQVRYDIITHIVFYSPIPVVEQ